MNQIPQREVRKLINCPEQYAEDMTLAQIDRVVAGLISVRYAKQRWSG